MGMSLEVYDRANPKNRIARIPFRTNPKFLEELGSGGGSFDIRNSDTRLAYLKERNIVKVRVNGKIVSAFTITGIAPKTVDSGEFSDEITTISGKGLKQGAADASVHPFGGVKLTSGDDRSFNFSSPKGSWLDLKSWDAPGQIAKRAAKGSPWGTAPAEWPDFPNAYWIWDPGFGYVDGRPVIIGDRYVNGLCFFRHDFSITKKGKFSFFCAADDFYEVYVDGQRLAEASVGKENWTQTQRIDFDLEPGDHVIGVKVQNTGGVGGFIGALAEVGDAATKKFARLLSVTNSKTWKIKAYPTENPGWTPGEIMIQLINEAKSRGVWWAKFLTLGFSASQDSNGERWDRGIDFSFTVGESYLSVINKMEELVCDIWVDPDTYTLHMAKSRGTDRTDPVKVSKVIQLRKGRELLGAEGRIEANIKNSLIVDTASGKMYVKDSASVAKYGVIEDSLNLAADSNVAKKIVEKVLQESSTFDQGATYKINPAPGSVPFDDFTVGDWILAPGEEGPKTKRRVSSISIAENKENGDVEYSVEFDTIFHSRQENLERWIANTLSGSMGGLFLTTKPVVYGPQNLTSVGTVSTAPPEVQIQAQNTVSAGYFNAAGMPSASLELGWEVSDAEASDLSEAGFKYYVYGASASVSSDNLPLLSVVREPKVLLTDLPAGEDYKVKVVAESGNGFTTETEPFTIELSVPESDELPIPTIPTCETNVGSITVTWDGAFSQGEDRPPQLAYVRIVASTQYAGPYTLEGPTIPRTGGSSVFTGLTQGETWYVALESVDTLGKRSLASEPQSVVVKGVGLVDIDSDLDDEIESIRESADGKNSLYYLPEAPDPEEHGPFKVGDTWFDTDNDYRIKRWDGSDWVTSLLGTEAIEDASITNAKISNLDAGKISTGYLSSSRIEARSITADKLTISSFGDNSVMNGGFEDGLVGWTTAGTISVETTTTSASGMLAASVTPTTSTTLDAGTFKTAPGSYIPVDSGESWVFSVRLYGRPFPIGGNNVGPETAIVWYDSTLNPLGGTVVVVATVIGDSYQEFSAGVTVPVNAKFAQIEFRSVHAVNTRPYYVDNVNFKKRVTAVQIADGAVTAEKIQANAVTASKIASDAIDGKVITGATIRTAATGQRLQLDTVGLRAYNSSNALTASLLASSGGLTLTGSINTQNGDVTSTYSTGRIASLRDGRVYLASETDASSYITTTGFYGNSNSWFDFQANPIGETVAFTGLRLSSAGGLGIQISASQGDIQLNPATIGSGGRIASNRSLKVLWEGANWPTATQTLPLSETVSSQLNGIVLEWSDYTDGSATNAWWNYSHIPKPATSRDSIAVPIQNALGTTYKLVNISNSSVVGHAANNASPRNRTVLRRIYGY